MIKLKLFDSTETNFKHNKRVLNEASKCNITEDVEGIFQLDLEYPLFDTKNLSKELKKGRIISANYRDRGQQLFKIRRVKKSTKDRKVTVFADCIARADLMTNFIKGIRIKNMTRKQAIAYMLANLVDKRRKYNVGNLDINSPTLPEQGLDDSGNVIDYLDLNNISGLEALNKIKEAYSGEIIFNNFEINIVDSIGTNKTHKITSTKNLEELEEDIDDTIDDFATAVIPCTSDELYLPDSEYILYSPLANKYNRYYYKPIKYDDVNFEELAKSASTSEDIEKVKQICYDQLRERVAKEWDNGLDKLKENYTVNFIELAKTEEYKDYIQLEQAYLGDKVKTIYSKIGINVESRITKIVYNVLLDKVEELEIGARKNSSIIDNINKVESSLKESIINSGRTISVVKRDISSRLEYTEEKLRSSINEVITTTKQKFDNTNKLIDENITAIQTNSSDITQLSDKVESEVASTKKDLNNVKETVTDMKSKVEQLPDSITSTVAKAKTELQGEINTIEGKVTETNTTVNNQSSQIEQLSNQINKTVTKDNFGSLVQQNYDSVSVAIKNKTNSSAIFDADGLTINEGKFRINKDGEDYLSIGNNGSVNSRRGYSVYDSDGTERLYMSRDGIDFSYDESGSVNIKATSRRRIEVSKSLRINDSLDVSGDLEVGDEDNADSSVYMYGECIVYGDFRVKRGDKNCIQETKNYGDREIYAYETAESYFGDIGNGVIKKGECVVAIDNIFSECVNTNIDYCVFTQVYNGAITRIKRQPTYFIVYGEDDTEFCWELKAKRLGKENNRLEEFVESNKEDKYLVSEDTFLKEINNDDSLENELLKIK